MLKIFRGSVSNPLAPYILILGLIILVTVLFSGKKSVISAKNYPTGYAEQVLSLDGHTNPLENEVNYFAPDITALTESAVSDWSRGDFLAAEDKFRTILVFQPENPVALSHLGAFFHHKGKYKDAEFMFRRQTQFFPTNPHAFTNLGMVLAKQNKLKEAISASERGFALNPTSGETALNLAKIYALAGDSRTCFIYFARAAAAMPGAIVEASWDPAFDNVRNEKHFRQIIDHASRPLKKGKSK